MKVFGVVAWTAEDRNGKPIAGVEPLFDVTNEDWSVASPEDFPENGQAFWFQAHEAKKDALVFFRAVENAGQKDAYRVSDAQPAIEVIDLRRHGAPESVRLALSRGVKLFDGPCARAILWCHGDVFVGPIKIGATSNTEIGIERNQLHRLPCYKLPKTDPKKVQHNGLVRYVLPTTTLGTPFTYLDWDDDRTVARRAIEFAIKRAKDEGIAIEKQVTKQIVLSVAERLSDGDGGADLQLERYRLERICALLPKADKLEGLVDDFLAKVQRLPAVETAVAQVLKLERAQAREAIEAELKKEKDALEQFRKERAETELKVKHLRKDYDQKKATLERELAKTVTLQASQVTDQGTGAASLVSRVPMAPQAPERVVKFWTTGSHLVQDQQAFRRSLVGSLKAAGVAPSLLWRLHAAFAGRLMPVLSGPMAMDSLEAYARIAAGGRMTVIPASATMLDAVDLFGRVDLGRGRFIPQAGGLIDLIAAARESEGLHLVVIEGANRGATESYLLPLLRLALGRGGAMPLFHPAAVDASDPYLEDHEVRWPSNLLLAATLVEGPTTLPVAPNVWFNSVLIQPEPLDEVKATEQPVVSDLSPGSGLLALPSSSSSLCDEVLELLEGIPGLRDIRPALLHYARALECFAADKDKVIQDVASCILVPYLASMQLGARESLVAELEVRLSLGPDDDLRGMVALAGRAVS
jgi:hypothetical protein